MFPKAMHPEDSRTVAENWKRLQESGMLWFINRQLILTGVELVVETDESSGEVVAAYPRPAEDIDFTPERNARGIRQMKEHLADLLCDCDDTAPKLAEVPAAPEVVHRIVVEAAPPQPPAPLWAPEPEPEPEPAPAPRIIQATS